MLTIFVKRSVLDDFITNSYLTSNFKSFFLQYLSLGTTARQLQFDSSDTQITLCVSILLQKTLRYWKNVSVKWSVQNITHQSSVCKPFFMLEDNYTDITQYWKHFLVPFKICVLELLGWFLVQFESFKINPLPLKRNIHNFYFLPYKWSLF